MIISICGKSGSGKSTLAKRLMNENSSYLEIDKVGHKVLTLREVQEELIKNFGNEVVKLNVVDRKKLGEIVFNKRKEMSKLADITWKYMEREIDAFLENNKDKRIILDYLLLPLTKYFEMSDIKILLDTPLEERLKRTIKRDHITKEEFLLREKASIQYDESKFDYVLKNDEEIKRLVKKL